MKTIFFWVGLFFLAIALFCAWFVPSAWFVTPAANATTLSVTIPQGASVRMVGQILADRGAIASSFGYRLYGIVDRMATQPRPGTYLVQSGQSYHAYAHIFATGPSRDEVSVTVIEGWTLQDEGGAMSKFGASWTTPLVDNWKADYPFLSDLKNGTTLEGYAFPDTYRVWKDQLPNSLLKKQLDAFGALAPHLMEEAKKQGRTLQDVVTLASIVEKEVAKPEDRKIVAGIFWNRLQSGMPLQSDATLNYITRTGHARLTAADLKIDSPYNTYMYKGLPPGPIGNPGADALEAALFPEKTSYRYFLTDANGKTYFATTLDEHIRNRYAAYGE